MPPQGYSKGTLALATAARNVAETAIPRAFKNGVVPTVPRSETVAITPFPKHWNQCLLTLNLNVRIKRRSQRFQRFSNPVERSGTQKALFFSFSGAIIVRCRRRPQMRGGAAVCIARPRLLSCQCQQTRRFHSNPFVTSTIWNSDGYTSNRTHRPGRTRKLPLPQLMLREGQFEFQT